MNPISKSIPLQEACMALGVTASTLNRWMKRSNIEAQSDVVDQRKHVISLVQLQHLARLHGKQLHPVYSSGGMHIQEEIHRIEDVASKTMPEQVSLSDEILKRLDAIEGRLNRIQGTLDNLISAPTPKQETPSQPEHKPIASTVPRRVIPARPSSPRRVTLSQVELTSKPAATHADVPLGSLLVREFARRHSPPSRDWYQLRIERGEIQAIAGSYHGKPQYWLSPEQQRVALAYIREKGIKYGRCDDEACPCHG